VHVAFLRPCADVKIGFFHHFSRSWPRKMRFTASACAHAGATSPIFVDDKTPARETTMSGMRSNMVAGLALVAFTLLGVPGDARGDELQAWVDSHLNDQGWFDLAGRIEANLAAGGRIVYVSSSEGDDIRHGLTPQAAKRSLRAARALLRDGQPDMLLLRRGDVWDEPIGHSAVSGRSAELPRIISAYGQGERPVVQTRGAQRAFEVHSGGRAPQTSHLVIHGIHFRSVRSSPEEHPFGIFYLREGRNVWIEDCVVERYKDGIVIQGDAEPGPRNFVIRRNVIVDSHARGAHAQGIYMDRVHGALIEQNLFDHNGWIDPGRADATIFNHNLYLQHRCSGITVRQNIIARASSHGLQLRGGGVIEGNVFVGNPIAMHVSGGSVDESHISGNAILDGGDIRPDLPRGWGMLVDSEYGQVRAVTISGNILARDGSSSGHGHAIIVSDRLPALIADNVIYSWRGRSQGAAADVRNTRTGGFIDPDRSLGTYAATIGLEPSLEAFLQEARKGWRPEVSAEAVIRHLSEGFQAAAEEPDEVEQVRQEVRDLRSRLDAVERRQYRIVAVDE
jgi:hypothetical protein